jgi:glycosyltransferase involved in cell wall biosynthesis
MNKTWIDLTDLFEWKGHFTGIQRVTYNYAYRFNAEGAHFFVYSNLYERFIEVPFSLIEQLKEEDEAGLGLTKRQIAKRKLKQNYLMLPKPVRSMTSPVLGRANKLFRKFAAMILDRDSRERRIRKLPTANFGKQDIVLLLGAGWNSKGLINKLAAKKQELDLTFIQHLNDILPIYQPYLFAEELPRLFAKYVKKSLQIADTVTVISKATKSDVVRYCQENNIQTPRVEIIRLGENMTTAPPQKPDAELSDKFVLCVGTLEIRKNYILLYQAIRLALSEGKTLPQIVIAGRKGWLTNDLQYVIEHDPTIKDKLILLEKVSDANLSWLYENCHFTVFASLAEGWGLPIAESLQHGKFCLSSNTSSMPEIAGDKIAYFNPYDTRDCMEKIEKYATKDKKTLNNQINASHQVFTWTDSFRQYEELITGHQVRTIQK